MKKVIIKCNDDFDHGMVEFTLPDGRKLSVFQIDYDDVYTGDQSEPSQYRYTAYGDYYGYDIDEFEGKTVVEYGGLGFKKYDENELKFCKKVCLYYSKMLIDGGWDSDTFEMPEKYLKLLETKKPY